MQKYFKYFFIMVKISLVLTAAGENAPLVEFLFDDDTFNNTGSLGSTAQAIAAGGKSAPIITGTSQGVGGGRALDLSANTMGSQGGYIKLNDNDALNGLQSLTVQCWFKKNESFDTSIVRLAEKMNYSGSCRYGFALLHAYYSSNSLQRDIGDDDGQYLGAANDFAAINANDQWIFVAMTWDATTSPSRIKTYIGNDSSAVTLVSNFTSSTVGPTASSLYNTVALVLGAGQGGSYAFSGLMDNVRIWGAKTNSSGVLSQEQLEFWRQHDAGPSQATCFLNTIDDLKNLSCTGMNDWTCARLAGYRNTNDGGEGWYRLFLTDISCRPDNVAVIQAKNVNGYWLRVPDSAVNPHAWDYSVTLNGSFYFSWLDPDPVANTDCRNKLQLAINAADIRGETGVIGQLFITPGNFKVVSRKRKNEKPNN